MTRRPPHIPKRKPIPKTLRLVIVSRSGGICEREGCENEAREIDHIVPVASGGTNDEDNLQNICRICHVEKTGTDIKGIRKADRLAGKAGQLARRKRRGKGSIPSRPNPWPKGRKLPSRKFNR